MICAWILVGAGWLVSLAARVIRRRRLEPADAVVPAAAKRVVAHPERARAIHRIGLWPTGRVEKIPGGMRFTVSGTGFLDPASFAYSPRGEPARVGSEDVYTHLDGPWYLWDESS